MKNNYIIGGIVIAIIVFFAWMFISQNKPQPVTQTQPAESIQPVASDSGVAVDDKMASSEGRTGNVSEFVVEGSNFKFVPSEIKVKKGDKVRVTFKNTGGTHDFVIDQFNVASKRITGGNQDVVEFSADKAGTFEYYCNIGIHRSMGMKGNLIVE